MSESIINVAAGIQDDPCMKLGLRPADPQRPALLLGDYLTGTLPDHPANADYLKGVSFGMYGNDRYGVCGPTSVANSRREILARLKGTTPIPSQNDVYDLYRRSGNPNFDPATGADDNGVNMQTMLQAVAAGGIGGVKCLGFAKVRGTEEELKAAAAIFGFLLFGVDLQKSQQAQTNQGVWDYQNSAAWGGHAILGGAYEENPDGIDVITWAQRVRMTTAFMTNQLSEAWVVIWPEHLTDNAFLAGVNLQAFAADYQSMTGKPFPAVVPPPKPPTPSRAGTLVIDPVAKTIVYPSGWTAKQAAADFRVT